MNRLLVWTFLVASTALGAGCSALTDHRVGLLNGRLQPCPSAPRCVGSMETRESHRVLSLQFKNISDESWSEAIDILVGMPRTSIADREQNYVRAEVVSPWRVHTDDVELKRVSGENFVHIRSSGRIGYYDFDVNRDRVEAYRGLLSDAGLLAD